MSKAKDTTWNLVSFGVQALAGAVLNIYLIWREGPATLGVFNQFYALFVVAGQLFSFGIQDSAQKHLAEFEDDLKRNTIEKAAIANSLLSSLVTVLAMTAFGLAAPFFLKSESLREGIFWLVPAIALFQFNKVLMGTILGRKLFRTYAIGQALRALFLVFFTLGIVTLGSNDSFLGAAFLLTEMVVGLYLLLGKKYLLAHAEGKLRPKAWARRHWNFGMRSLCQNLLTETFIRVDVLVLTLFMDDKAIGTYSFVAFFFEGIFQIPYLFRVLTNPTLVPIVKAKDFRRLVEELRKVVLLCALITIVTIVTAIALFPYIKSYMGLPDDELSRQLLLTLLLGLGVHSFFSPFDNILLQGGRPATQSVYMSVIAGLNICLNFLLVPKMGLMGAAVATATSFALSGPVLILFFYFSFDVRLWTKSTAVGSG